MGLVGRLIVFLTGGGGRSAPLDRSQELEGAQNSVNPLPGPQPASPEKLETPSEQVTLPVDGGFSFTFTEREIDVPDSEVAAGVQKHAYVLTNDPPALNARVRWWEDKAHERRLRTQSDKAWEWLSPFIPEDIAKLERLQPAQQRGPHGAVTLAKAIRAIIRERRKAKEPYGDHLRALYGACVLADFFESLEFETSRGLMLTPFVSSPDLLGITLEYRTLGYKFVRSLGKTDIKWLVEAFGEPASHQAFDDAWPRLRQDAISRYCWAELRSSNGASKAIGAPQKTMAEWLHRQVKLNIGYQTEWRQDVAAREARNADYEAGIEAAWKATRQPFVVADIETTGLNVGSDEILELAALRVDAAGSVTAEFSALVAIQRPVSGFITELTGITQGQIDQQGLPIATALAEFTAFIGAQPVFFHNAPFDKRFILKAAEQSGLVFTNPVHDTLPIARFVWPTSPSHKLADLASRVGAAAPTHRGLSDAKAALAVLLAARSEALSPS